MFTLLGFTTQQIDRRRKLIILTLLTFAALC